jgi:hypothetical protein
MVDQHKAVQDQRCGLCRICSDECAGQPMALLEGKREEEDVVLLNEDVQVLQGLQGLQGLLNHLFSDNIMR